MLFEFLIAYFLEKVNIFKEICQKILAGLNQTGKHKSVNDFTLHNHAKTSDNKPIELSAILHGLHNTGVCG